MLTTLKCVNCTKDKLTTLSKTMHLIERNKIQIYFVGPLIHLTSKLLGYKTIFVLFGAILQSAI